MDFIEKFNTHKCTNCYKCVQDCYTKAITIDSKNKDIIIDNDLCVGCGFCTKACKSDILTLTTDLEDVISLLNQNTPVYIILDTIYQSDFEGITFNQMRAAFKDIGFKDAVENFTGFALHSYLCHKHFKETNKTTLKTFCIPFNNYIMKFYPDLLDLLSPITTPENISSRLLKEQYGQDIITVYATTCFSYDNKTTDYDCDYVILTSDIKKLFELKNINPFSYIDDKTQLDLYSFTEPETERIETIEDCTNTMNFLRKNPSYSSLIAPYWCNSCFSSPVLTNNLNSYERRRLYSYYREKNYNIIELNDDNINKFGDLSRFFTTYTAQPVEDIVFKEEEIIKALQSFGRNNTNDYFDCGACGYATCRENAIAILKGKSTPQQCIPYISKEFEKNIANLDKTYKELDDAFALTIPNSRLELKLKNTREYQDIYIKETNKIKIIGIIEDGTYRHVVNALKVAADLYNKGVMSIVGFDKDVLVKTIIFHDIGKSQPILNIGDEVDAKDIFENGKLHAERSADLALANYEKEGITDDIYLLIKYHHHTEQELPQDFPLHLKPMYRLFRIIDGISAGLTRRKNTTTFDIIGSVLYIREDSQNPNYKKFYSIDLYKPEYMKKEYDFNDDLNTVLYTNKYK